MRVAKLDMVRAMSEENASSWRTTIIRPEWKLSLDVYKCVLLSRLQIIRVAAEIDGHFIWPGRMRFMTGEGGDQGAILRVEIL